MPGPLTKFLKNFKRRYLLKQWQKEYGGNTKYFCIGRNKTGTTSLEKAFVDLGIKVGSQREAALLLRDYFNSNFKPIIELCKTAQAFQDVPFSYPGTFKELDKAFPGSKFILSIRDSSDQWYKSVVNFHAKRYGSDGPPSAEQLKNAGRNVWKGWIWESISGLYGTDESDPYNKEKLIHNYESHNAEVIAYFKDRPDDLLVINLSEKGAYQRFCDFIKIKSKRDNFPWENKT